MCKKEYRPIGIVLLMVVALILCNPHNGYSVDHFADGQAMIYQDQVGGVDAFYGGFDMAAAGAPLVFVGSTDLTFSVVNQPANNIFLIAGGGRGTAALASTIDGDANLTVHNSTVVQIFGGGVSDNTVNPTAPAIVTGTARIKLYDSDVTELYGGGGAIGGTLAHVAHVKVGAVDILVNNSRVDELFGSAHTVGIQSQGRYAVYGDINIKLENGSEVNTLIGTSHASAHVKGNLNIDINDSQVNDLYCLHHAYLDKNLTVRVGEGATVTNFYLSGEGSLGGAISLLIDGGTVNNMRFVQPGIVKSAEIVLKKGMIDRLDFSIAQGYAGTFENLKIDVEGGQINNVTAVSRHGTINNLAINVKPQGRIEQIVIGGNGVPDSKIKTLVLNLKGGTVNRIECEPLGVTSSIVRFAPGIQSRVHEFGGTGAIGRLEIPRDAEARLGVGSGAIDVKAFTVNLEGTLVVPEDASVTLVTLGDFVANGGALRLESITKGNIPTGPQVYFDGGALGGVHIDSPLILEIGTLEQYIGQNKVIPVAQARSAAFAKPELFRASKKGFVWTDMDFDRTTNIWSIKNIRGSEAYYGYAAGRKAVGWLHSQSLETGMQYSTKALFDKRTGLWVNVQGGQEELASGLGTSKMPWGSSQVGYTGALDFSEKVSGVYGGSVGLAGAWNTWKYDEITRNKIQTAFVSGHVGFAYADVYSIVGIQFSVGEVKSDSGFFETNKKWSEVSPTESLELGWRYAVVDGFNLIPRGKVFLEQVGKRTVDFEYGGKKETVELRGTTNITTLVGLIAEYDVKPVLGIGMNAYVGLDWLYGVAGSYEAYSRVFSKGFKENNDDSVIRVSIGGAMPVAEGLVIGAKLFSDMMDNKGMGIEANVGYSF